MTHALGWFICYAGIGLLMMLFALAKMKIDKWWLERWRRKTFGPRRGR